MVMAYQQDPDAEPKTDSGGTTTAVKPAAARPRTRRLPPWNVLLHNDDVNDMGYVAAAITELTSLNRHDAVLRMLEAHEKGIALLLATHREHAELLCEQFASKHLTVTAEPAP
jgi:ATP-dependent Clp protease adaptor protein ClpS